jgi:hypothetical protein
MVPFHFPKAVVNDGEIPETKKVHLEKPKGFACRVVKLRDDLAILVLPQRHMVNQRLCRNDYAGRMDARLTDQPFNPSSRFDHSTDIHVTLIE